MYLVRDNYYIKNVNINKFVYKLLNTSRITIGATMLGLLLISPNQSKKTEINIINDKEYISGAPMINELNTVSYEDIFLKKYSLH